MNSPVRRTVQARGKRSIPEPGPCTWRTKAGAAIIFALLAWMPSEASAHTRCVWQLAPTRMSGELVGVAALSRNDVWAVGSRAAGARPLIAHWNGRAWAIVQSPVLAGALNDVVALSAHDVWAVGSATPAGSPSPSEPLIIHWDGAMWSVVPTDAATSGLLSITAASPTTLWAVGTGPPIRWTAGSWQRVTGPESGSVTATSTSNVWAAGTDRFEPTVHHWYRGVWTTLTLPNTVTGNDLYSINAVAAVSAAGAWSLERFDSGITVHVAIVDRWNGKKWADVLVREDSTLEGLAIISAHDVWAVGARLGGIEV